jgi:hypothetical protein
MNGNESVTVVKPLEHDRAAVAARRPPFLWIIRISLIPAAPVADICDFRLLVPSISGPIVTTITNDVHSPG